MPDALSGQSGQSNANFINRDPTAPDNFAIGTLGHTAVAQVLIDPAGTTVTMGSLYTAESTAIGGVGLVFDSSPAITLQGDSWYEGRENFVRPSAEGLPTWDDWTTWPLTTQGQLIVDTYAGFTTQQKADMQVLHWFQSEYDSAGYATNTWTRFDPRIWERGMRRIVAAVRAAVGKTAAQLPVLLSGVMPYQPAVAAGAEAIWAATMTLVRDPAFNARLGYGNLMDLWWDRDDGGGGNDGVLRFHAHKDDQNVIGRRYGYALARHFGQAISPTTNRIYAGLGPVPVHARWIDNLTIDVSVRHDGGNDLTLFSTPANGWRVTYGGVVVTVSSVTKTNGRTLRLTLASACDVPDAIRVFYTFGAARLATGTRTLGVSAVGGIYDNASSWDGKAIPAAISGANRINFPLARTPPGGLTPTAAAPAAQLLLPLAA
jgi:hypothetical protein